MTTSCLATSASRAFSSLTSREMAEEFLTPAESFLADSRVLQASHNSQYLWLTQIGNHVPTVTGMPDSVRMSSVGRVTNPAPSIKTDLPCWVSGVARRCCRIRTVAVP